MHQLFFQDQLLDLAGLRKVARSEVEQSTLITRSAEGDLRAAKALLDGFWPFVSEFEVAIDKHRIPRQPLQLKFGKGRTIEYLRSANAALQEMSREEGSHAIAWKNGAGAIGVHSFSKEVADGVQQLVDASYEKDEALFFAVLAGTEFIAEELSDRLVHSPAFTALFPKGRWLWGDIHLLPHDGPSHLELDIDLARAYGVGTDSEIKGHLEGAISNVARLFGQAARDVERLHLKTNLRIAA